MCIGGQIVCVCVHVCGFLVVVLCETSKLCVQIPIESTLVFRIRKNKGCVTHSGLAIYIKKYLSTLKKNYRNSNISPYKNIPFQKSHYKKPKSFKVITKTQ